MSNNNQKKPQQKTGMSDYVIILVFGLVLAAILGVLINNVPNVND